MKRQYVSDNGGNSSIDEIAETLHIPRQTARLTLIGAINKIFAALLTRFTVEEIMDMYLSYRSHNCSPVADMVDENK